jgi:ADP-ribose pyrophosphatase YjhB (NUDIX family)
MFAAKNMNRGQRGILCAMLSNVFGAIWRRLPKGLRNRISQFGTGRFTVSVAAMMFDAEGRILLFEHVFRPSAWGVPGGFVAKGEQPDDALRREMREEANLEIDNIKLLFVRTLANLKRVEVYYQARPIGMPQPASFEIKSTAWFRLNELPPELSKDQRGLITRSVWLMKNGINGDMLHDDPRTDD